MNFNEYQIKSRVTAMYPNKDDDFIYPAFGLVGESGEIADKLKKCIRDENIHKPSELSDQQRLELAKELGDVLWYIAQLATEFKIDLGTIADMNIEKLYSRMDRGKLGGSGDNR